MWCIYIETMENYEEMFNISLILISTFWKKVWLTLKLFPLISFTMQEELFFLNRRHRFEAGIQIKSAAGAGHNDDDDELHHLSSRIIAVAHGTRSWGGPGGVMCEI